MVLWVLKIMEKHLFGLERGSEPKGQAREDLPQNLFDLLDLLLEAMQLDFERFGWKFSIFDGHPGVWKNCKNANSLLNSCFYSMS